MKTIALLDYGAGNISSLMNALTGLETSVYLTGDPKAVLEADLLIIPGVGAFGDAIQALKEKNLASAIVTRHELGKPILGICLGMQLFFDVSEELGLHSGLGLLRGRIKRMRPQDPALKVPHMGWNAISPERGALPGYLKPFVDKDVYFVHSYCLFEGAEAEVMLSAHYAMTIPAIVDNLYTRKSEGRLIGFQFHPEKSGTLGQKLLHAAIKEAIHATDSST